MDTERVSVSAIRPALAAACPSLTDGTAADAVAGVVPSFVASPSSTAEVSALLREAAAAGLAVVPRGAGTGLAWGAPPSRCDLVVDLRSMDHVVEHEAGDLVARVQAGATIGQLAVAFGSAGQQLALDVPAEATVGGVVATGTAGPRRFRYGAPRDLLIGITVVRADGVVAQAGGKVVKNVAGYDLGKLFAGSQGTLGVITEAAFRLHPLPAAVAWVTAEFGPAERAGAVTAVAAAAGSPLVPSAVELDWPGGSQRPLRVGVLLEGTGPGWPNGPGRCPSCWRRRAVRSRSPRPRPRAGVLLPSSVTVVRVSFWVSSLGPVLDAVAAAGADAGVRPAVSGPAGAGALYACLDPGTADEDAVRFVTALRERVAGALESGGPRGGVTVLTAPPAVFAACLGRDGSRPGPDAGGQGPVRSGPPDVPRPIRRRWLVQDENTLREVAKDCVHCGFCLPACPTYQLWAEEMDSPRGRIHLVNQILDGAELTATAAEHFDRCLGCMACMTACPSGVQYDQLIEAARVWTEEARPGGSGAGRHPPKSRRVWRDRVPPAATVCGTGSRGRPSSRCSPTPGGCGR